MKTELTLTAQERTTVATRTVQETPIENRTLSPTKERKTVQIETYTTAHLEEQMSIHIQEPKPHTLPSVVEPRTAYTVCSFWQETFSLPPQGFCHQCGSDTSIEVWSG